MGDSTDYKELNSFELTREFAKNNDTEALKEILIRAKSKDPIASQFLIRKYESFIFTIISKGFFLKNGNKDDLYSEGLLGLYRAIKDFDETKGNSENFQKKLENFFYMCIHRSIITAINSANRLKNIPLNEMTSLDRTLQDNENITVMDMVASKSDVQNKIGYDFSDPAEQHLAESTIERYTKMLNEIMSDTEKDVWELRKKGHSYKEIGELLGYSGIKKVDNALHRIKKKSLQIIEEEEKKTYYGL